MVARRRIDLHTHSSYSDGSDSPAELVDQAVAAGLDVIALTDHDTVRGIPEAAAAIAGRGLALVPGIELSAQVIDHPGATPRSVHLLGYFIDPDHAELHYEMERIRAHRADRLRLMVGKLSADYDITWDEVLAGIPPGATPGRPHVAEVLIAKGYVPDTTAAFAGPLRADGPYHVPHYAPRLHTAIALIRSAGGVAVLAHPFTDERSGAIDHRLPDDQVLEGYRALQELGLAGLEIDHQENSAEGKDVLGRIASELGFIRTGSSDYHGAKKPNQLGDYLTDADQFEAIQALGTGSGLITG